MYIRCGGRCCHVAPLRGGRVPGGLGGAGGAAAGGGVGAPDHGLGGQGLPEPPGEGGQETVPTAINTCV